MGDLGVCAVCSAEDVAINDAEMCEECAALEEKENNGDDMGVPEGMIEEES